MNRKCFSPTHKSNFMLFMCILSMSFKFVPSSGELFSVYSDLESVEKLAIDYAKERHDSLSINRILSTPKRKFCYLSEKTKISLCWEFLKKEYEFEFTLNIDKNVWDPDCEERDFSLRIFDQNQVMNKKIEMFSCPPLDEARFLEKAPNFLISDTYSVLTVIVFVQENRFSRIRPYKYLDEIKINDLQSDLSPLLGSYWSKKYEMQRMHEIKSIWMETQTLEKLVSTNRIRNPYTKFKVFHGAVDICTLSLTQKIYLCRLIKNVFQSKNDDFDVNEYTKDGCRKYNVEYNHEKEKFIQAAFQCPPVIHYETSARNWAEKIYTTWSYFLAKSVPSSQIEVLILVKRILSFTFTVTGIDLQALQKIRLIERDTKYPTPADSSRMVSSSTDKPESDQKKYQYAFPIEINRKEAERSTIEFVKLTQTKSHENKSTYRKFSVAYRIWNICHLRTVKKIELCEIIFENQELDYKIKKDDTNGESTFKCIRRLISLVASKVIFASERRENAFKITLLNCHAATNRVFPTGLFLSASLQLNSLIAYENNINYNEISAIAVVPKEIRSKISTQGRTGDS